MADRFYSVTLGEQSPDQITTGGSTSSEAIEFRVETTGLTKTDVLKGLDVIKNYIVRANWPPA